MILLPAKKNHHKFLDVYGFLQAFCLCFVPICSDAAVKPGCTCADPHGREAFCLCTVPICSGDEVALGRACAEARGRKALCMHFVPVCVHDPVSLDHSFADAHWRKAFRVHTVPICSGTEVRLDQAFADTQVGVQVDKCTLQLGGKNLLAWVPKTQSTNGLRIQFCAFHFFDAA
jgi:hypothetical protein